MDKKRLIATTLSIAAVLTLATSLRFNLGSFENASGITSLVGILTPVFLVLYGLANKYALHIPFGRTIGLQPNLNGTWVGSLQSNWLDPRTRQAPGPIPIMLTIKQTLTKIDCTLRTAESASYSYCGQFRETESGGFQLRYDYRNEPGLHLKTRSPDHKGTASFEVKENPDNMLVGSYLTERDTKGTMSLTLYSRARLDTLPTDLKPHPVSQLDAGTTLSPLTPLSPSS